MYGTPSSTQEGKNGPSMWVYHPGRGFNELLEQAATLAAEAGIAPVIDRVFPFTKAKEAYRYLESGAHFGKVVIDLTQ